MLLSRSFSSSVELTTNLYPNVKRGNFAKLDQKDVDQFKSILGSAGVKDEDLESRGKNRKVCRFVIYPCMFRS